jgi:putative flavoprotein involved in K+ transport
VLVVGGGQSGCQIVEDLLPTGRQIYLCTSKVGRLPRRYRGREILEWWQDTGFLDVALEDLEDQSVTTMRQPLISGVGRYGRTISLQQLAREGVKILGYLRDVRDGVMIISDNAADNVAFGDGLSSRFKKNIDDYLDRAGIEPPPLDDDLADVPDPDFVSVAHINKLSLKDADIRTVIWATGFTAKFDWIHLPVVDEEGMPVHTRGVSPVPGLYFLGFPWLHKRKSGILYGIEEDAGYLAEEINKSLAISSI